MERIDDERNVEVDRDVDNSIDDEHETHATTGGAAAAGAVTGGVIGLTGGPVGAVVGAVGGAIIGAAAERMMHSDEDADHVDDEAVIAQRDATMDTPRATVGDVDGRPEVVTRDDLGRERDIRP